MSETPRTLALAGELSKIDHLRELLGSDAEPQLLLDTIEGETNLLEHLDEIVRAIIVDEGYAEIVRERIKRLETRAAKRRAVVLQIMERMSLKKAERPEYTLSVAAGVPSVHITHPDLISLGYQRMSPDKAAIARDLKQGIPVDGAQLSNAPPVLRISVR